MHNRCHQEQEEAGRIVACIAVHVQSIMEADLHALHDSRVCRVLPVQWQYCKGAIVLIQKEEWSSEVLVSTCTEVQVHV